MLTRPAALHVPTAEVPVLVAGVGHALWVTPDGEIEELTPQRAEQRVREQPPLLCHVPATARRLGIAPFRAFDLLELFAFVRPARFCLPTPRGLAAAVGLPPPRTPLAEAEALLGVMHRLLAEVAEMAAGDPSAGAIAWTMAEAGWPWGPSVIAGLGPATGRRAAGQGLAVWRRLPAWSEQAPEPAPGNRPVEPAEARRRLADLLGGGDDSGRGPDHRPQQSDYASAICPAFQPRARADAPQVVLAEAGTGVGKTLGYIAPASLWAERNGAAVWISTYTRNLQHQIDGEFDRLFPEAQDKREKVVIRKGRENYLCLLNLEEAVRAIGVRPGEAVALGLMARWAERTRDGDMVGGDFPAWLADLLGAARTRGLADQRGECIYAACPHFQKCFIERNARRARRAEIVIANHALVMVQAALGGLDDGHVPTRYVFDEGHHLFDAADSAFSATLSGLETAELRRWLLGAEGGSRSRARGLKRRIEDLTLDDETATEALEQALRAAAALPG